MKKTGGYARLGIFQCSDKDGKIDDYIPYLLEDMKENLDRLVIVFNGRITPAGRKRLLALTDDVVVRENKGFDAAAWKYAMTEYLGWEQVRRYEELVLFNDTFYGPFYPFQTIFDQMADQNLDFWGLTAHGKGMALGADYNAHLQSYFLVIRKPMLHSFEFESYWEKQKLFQSFQELVEQNEVVFTKYFEECGFTWKPFIDTQDLDGKHAMNHYAFNAEELLKKGFPILKRKQFQESLGLKLYYHNGEDYLKALQYVKEHYSYDVSMIWKNILRLYNISDIHDALDLDYVIDAKNPSGIHKEKNKRVAVALHLYYTKDLNRYEPYIRAIPDGIDVIITTVSAEKTQLIRQAYQHILGTRLTVLCMPNRGRDMAALLVAAKPYLNKYDYFCFCHDKLSAQTEYSIGKYFERLLWENTLSSTVYIENILARFASEPQLGILTAPSPIGGYFGHFPGQFWTVNYEKTKDLLKKLDIQAPISNACAPLTFGTAFWSRTDALKKLLDHPWTYEDFPKEPLDVDGQISHALERCFAFVAQDSGYYTAVAMTPEYAQILVNAYKYLAYHPSDGIGVLHNYMCITDSNMPDVGIRGALHLLRLTIRRYLRKIRLTKRINEYE